MDIDLGEDQVGKEPHISGNQQTGITKSDLSSYLLPLTTPIWERTPLSKFEEIDKAMKIVLEKRFSKALTLVAFYSDQPDLVTEIWNDIFKRIHPGYSGNPLWGLPILGAFSTIFIVP